jgi:alanine racemase
MSSSAHSTWVNIDLLAIENNVSVLAHQSGVPVMAVVKANAYGHGIIPVSQAALRGGAEWLAVARVEEALRLRSARITCPLLVMGYVPEEYYRETIEENISITIWSVDQLKALEALSSTTETPAKVHLKIDTGMNRLGVSGDDSLPLAVQINAAPNVLLEGIFTHYARADELDLASAQQQEREYLRIIKLLNAAGIHPTWVHAANSAGSLYMPDSRFSLVRPGISIYGLHPSHERQLPVVCQTALEWKAVLSQVKILPPGSGISYGHEYVTKGHERIGTIPVGYADGFRRTPGNQVLVGGKLVPVVGRVCMDQVCVQLDQVPDAQAGDEVVIIGAQGELSVTAEQVADRWGTINYEVVCGIAERVPRIYHPSSG